MTSVALLKAVAVTAELCGRVFSEPAARVFVDDLSAYDEAEVIKALARCRREVRGALTVQDVVSRIDDGRPGPEEAWAMLPKDDYQSAVWTEEMREAHTIASPLLAAGEDIPARMAFKEAYTRLVSDARNSGARVSWTPTLGYDKSHREATLARAVELGRIPADSVAGLLPSPPPNPSVLAGVAGLLSGPDGRVERPLSGDEVRRRVAELKKILQKGNP